MFNRLQELIANWEGVTWTLTLVAAVGLWGFIELSDQIQELPGNSEAMKGALDQTILLWFRNPADLSDPVGPTWFEEAARDVTALGSTAVLTLATLACVGFMFFRGRHQTAGFLAVAVLGGLLISFSLKAWIDRPRPSLVPHGTRVYSQSFPSGHASMSAVVFLTLGALVTRAQASLAGGSRQTVTSQLEAATSQSRIAIKLYIMSVAMLLTLLVGVSRVYLGVHWPSDVLAGWLVGAAWAAVCWLAYRRWQHSPAGIAEQQDAPPDPPA